MSTEAEDSVLMDDEMYRQVYGDWASVGFRDGETVTIVGNNRMWHPVKLKEEPNVQWIKEGF
jgi:hypothetical protein